MIKKNKFFLLAIIFAFSFIITSCVDIHTDIYVNSDGSGRVEIIYDYTTYFQLTEQEAQFKEENLSLQEVCEGVYGGLQGQESFEDVSCEVDGYKVKVVMTLSEGGYDVIVYEDGTYSYLLDSDNPIFETSGTDILDENMEETNNSNSEISEMKITYAIHFEGEIVESNMGLIEGNKLFIDIMNSSTKLEDLQVKAKISEEKINNPKTTQTNENTGFFQKQKNNPEKLIITIVIIILIFAVVLIILKKKKKPTQEVQTTQELFENKEIAPNIKKIIDWIHQNEKHYPEETLRQSLRNSNIPQQEIDYAFKMK